MAQIIFNNFVVESHPAFNRFGSTLQTVSEGVYKKRYKFNEKIKCIDGDELVSNKDSSVDAIIGISDYATNKISNHRLMLIELRMDYVTKEDLRKSKHIKKVSGTLQCLGRVVPIDTKSYFIFDHGFIQKAKRVFSDWRNEGGHTRHFYALSVEEFNTKVLDKEELSKQYICKYPVEELEKELTAIIIAADWKELITKMNYLRKEIEVFFNTYKYKEIEPILQAYQGVWPKVKDSYPLDDDDIEIEMELIEEYYIALIRKHSNL